MDNLLERSGVCALFYRASFARIDGGRCKKEKFEQMDAVCACESMSGYVSVVRISNPER